MSDPRQARTRPSTLTRLNEDHRRLARVLKAFELEYQALGSDAGPDYELLRDILDYVQSFPDTIHHPTEDALFDFLVEHASLSAGEEAVIADNRAQHIALIEATRVLVEMIDKMFGGGDVDIAHLKLTMSKYLAEQRRHMEFENSNLFPLAEKRLSDADWKAIEHQLSQARDPLFEAYDEQYEALRRHIESSERSGA